MNCPPCGVLVLSSGSVCWRIWARLERVAYFNLTRQHQVMPQLGHAESKLLICSEAQRYAESRGGDDPLDALLPYEFSVYGPPSWCES